jgi:hypothetical protein
VDITGINGHTVLTGNGVTGAGSQRVTIASDNTAFTVNPALNSSVGLIQATATAAVSQTSATTAQVIALSGSTKIYVTHYHLVVSGAGTYAWIAGTGSNCGTNTTYLEGASGHPISLAANGGVSAGGGLGPILITPAGYALCLVTTGAVDTSGAVAYAQF